MIYFYSNCEYIYFWEKQTQKKKTRTMSAVKERLIRRIYESSVNALAMATAYTLTNYYEVTIGIVFASLFLLTLCEFMLYSIEVSFPKEEVSMADLVEVCKKHTSLIKLVANNNISSSPEHINTYNSTLTSVEMLLHPSLHNKRKTDSSSDMKSTLFVLLQEVLKIISRSAYFFSTYFLVKLYSLYSNSMDEYVTLLYFSIIIVLAPIIFVMLHAVIISPEKKI